jgi:hypothetical protein
MNVGMAEGHDLAGRLEEILRQGGNPTLLDEYSRTWTRTWRSLMGLDGALRPREGASDFVRRNAARILSCTPASGNDLPRLLEQVGLELPAGAV